MLHQVSHRLTAKAVVLKLKTLNVKGMVKNHNLSLSAAAAGMSLLVTFCAYKADWRGRKVEKIDPWFTGSQLCCACGARNREMKNLSVRVLSCEWANVMDRDHNPAVNHYWYREEPRNRAHMDATGGEIGDQGFQPQTLRVSATPVPVGKTRMLAKVRAHES